MNRMSSMEIGWLAGIVEGEGWFVKNPQSMNMSVAMTDYDTVKRLQLVTGVGRLEERTFEDKKNQLKWVVGVLDDLEAVLHTILPLMSERRSQQIHGVLEVIEAKRLQREWRLVHFVCGHQKSEENTYHFKNSDKTSCRQCGRDRDKARYASSLSTTKTIKESK